MTEPRQELPIRVYYASREQREVDIALDVEMLLEWAGADSLDDISEDDLVLFIEQHDPETMIGWGSLDGLVINAVDRLV